MDPSINPPDSSMDPSMNASIDISTYITNKDKMTQCCSITFWGMILLLIIVLGLWSGFIVEYYKISSTSVENKTCTYTVSYGIHDQYSPLCQLCWYASNWPAPYCNTIDCRFSMRNGEQIKCYVSYNPEYQRDIAYLKEFWAQCVHLGSYCDSFLTLMGFGSIFSAMLLIFLCFCLYYRLKSKKPDDSTTTMISNSNEYTPLIINCTDP